ncbi:MAG: apolipoprotein N-acyltransferase [Desulfobacteraceae bacterium 4572_35.1]|nr:MAG: apolipoprotein N-acyltransferase [Desulfobacteraceae bacterium 4572_35.1]
MISAKKKNIFSILAPLVSGLLFALAFPGVQVAWLAWVALVPLFVVVQQRPWRSGFSAGVIFFALVLYWLNNVMTTFGHLPLALSIVIYLLLVVYLACWWGLCCWCACYINSKLQLPLALVMPTVWLVGEYLRSYFLSGFPWGNIAYSQTPYPVLMQSADLGGVYVVVFLLIVVNYSIARLWHVVRFHERFPWRLMLIVVSLWLVNYAYGLWRIHDIDVNSGEALRVALIQGNVKQSLKWEPRRLAPTLNRYKKLSIQVRDAQLLVWPESATPFFFQDESSFTREVRELAREKDSMLLFGSPAYFFRGDSPGEKRLRYLNSAFLVSSQGETLGRSDKVHLVPFGEYVPFSELLSFVNKLAHGVGDFASGVKKLLPVAGHELGVLVCYEAIFPAIAREQVNRGAQLLVNITNDAWFGDSSAPWQHLAMTQWRAVENRVWLARCANSGVSALIDPLGRVVRQSQLFRQQIIIGNTYFCDGTSLYTRTGDIVPLLLTVVVVLWLWQGRSKRFSLN